MLSSASSDLGKIKFGDTYYYLRHQISFGLLIGIAAFLVFSTFSYRFLERASFLMLVLSVALLVLVFSPLGFSAGGASRWIAIGPFTMQPSELV